MISPDSGHQPAGNDGNHDYQGSGGYCVELEPKQAGEPHDHHGARSGPGADVGRRGLGRLHFLSPSVTVLTARISAPVLAIA